MELPAEFQYLFVVVGLFIVPRVLQRMRIPSAITCVAIGAAVGMGFHAFQSDSTVGLLATLGIVSLFLFAGIEVDLAELRRGLRVVIEHLLVQFVLLGLTAWAMANIFALATRPAVLMALALLTPSTGFILDSLTAFGLREDRAQWVKTKAIASEILALVVLFVTVQSSSPVTLGLSSLAIAVMVLILPPMFRVFARYLLPHAPGSEFSFLVIVAVLCAYLTRELGVYYLVGAFAVGVTALRMQQELPALASTRITHGIELFASFFIPFYFFKAGLHLEARDFTPRALGIGAAFAAVMIPVRIGVVSVHRRVSMSDPLLGGARVGLSLVPTLVFTIVIADILRDRYELPVELYGALIVVSLIDTTIPGLLLRAPTPGFLEPHVKEIRPVGPSSPAPAEPGSAPQGEQRGGPRISTSKPEDALDDDELGR
jgi:Kef-type K+ transport system membrane component KefB